MAEEDVLLQAQARVAEIAELLKVKAPKMCPQIVPSPFRVVVGNLLAACVTPQQRADADSYLEEKSVEAKALEGEGLEKPLLALDTTFDLSSKAFRITGAKFVGEVDATLNDLDRFMELQLSSTEAELEPYVSRFAAANELEDTMGRGAAMQDVYSLAYAMRIAISHMPGWTGYLGSLKLPLTKDVQIVEVLKELFQPKVPPQKKGGKKSKAKGKSKGTKTRLEGGAGEGVKPALGAKEKGTAPKVGSGGKTKVVPVGSKVKPTSPKGVKRKKG